MKLDWKTKFAPGEWEQLAAFYEAKRGKFSFATFMYRACPAALKRYRLYADCMPQGVGLSVSDYHPAVSVLVMAHYYCVVGYTEGILTDFEYALLAGARKQELAAIVQVARIFAAPTGMDVSEARIGEYLDTPDLKDGKGIDWPAGWCADPEIFRCGVAFDACDPQEPPPAEEVGRILDWYHRVQGEVPLGVGLLAERNPGELWRSRARYEVLMDVSLPRQLIAMCQIYTAAADGRPDALARMLTMGRNFGLSRTEVVFLLAFAQLYLGDVALDGVMLAAESALRSW